MIKKFRQAGLRAGVAGALGVAGLCVFNPAVAHADAPSPAAADELPPVGEHVVEPLAGDFTFMLNGQQCRAHLSGAVDEDVVAQDRPDATDTVAERGLRLRGSEACDSAAGNQTRAEGGTITIEQNDVDVDSQSLLKLTQQFPPRFEQIMVLGFTMTIDQPEGSDNQTRAGDGPLLLTTKDPAMLIGQLTQFPPRGDLYQLQNPVDLVALDNPDVTLATIEKFPVTVG